jgi:hypothetical protein
MDLTNSYYKKYLKYKNKYIKLQKQIKNKIDHLSNSNDLSNANNNQQENKVGGGYFYEQNDLIKRTNMLVPKKFSKDIYQFSSIYLKANLTNPQIVKKYSKIRKSILKNNSFPPHNYHLTLLIFEINLDYPIIGDNISYLDKSSKRRKVRKDLSFLNQEEIKKDFEEIFTNMVLTTVDYELLGKLTRIKLEPHKEIQISVKNPESNDCIRYPGSYFVDHFEVNNKNLITTFRTKFYEGMNEFMKKQYIILGGKEKNYIGYRADNETDPDYILIFYDNFSKDVPLIAIKKFYYGKNSWAPHISIFNMEELGSNNMKFLEKYVVYFLTYHDRTKTNELVFDELKKSKLVKELFRKSAKPKITINDIEFELQV